MSTRPREAQPLARAEPLDVARSSTLLEQSDVGPYDLAFSPRWGVYERVLALDWSGQVDGATFRFLRPLLGLQ